MRLRPIDKPFATANDFYEPVGGGTPCLVKVYRGRSARARRDREAEALAIWRRQGFDAPEVFELPLGDLEAPYLAISRLEGSSLRQILAGSGLEAGLEALANVLVRMRKRHDRALEIDEIRLVHPDSSTGNVMLTDSGVFFLDLEARPKFADVREAAAVEIGKLSRWAVRDLGMQHCRAALGELLKAYAGRRELLERVVQRVHGRRLQFLHRWRDRRKKAAQPGEVTKYDIADALAEVLRG